MVRGDGLDPNWTKGPFFRVPTRSDIFIYWISVGKVLGAFLSIYFTANLIASNRSSRFQFYFPWEKEIPLIEEFIFVYMSVFLFALLHLFVVPGQIMARAVRPLLWSVTMAGIVFLAFPTEIGYSWPPPAQNYHLFFNFLATVDKPHNLFPSLHICLSFILGRLLFYKENNFARLLLIVWFISVCFSIIFVHQHHVLDIVGGLFLGIFCMKYFFSAR